jgi:triosephosphate isomerase
MEPIVIINFKTYEEGSGERAVELARACAEVSKATGAEIIVAPQAADIFRVSSSVDMPVIAQAVDGVEGGQNTGKISPENMKEAGASGTLVNHSECRKNLYEIGKILEICRKLDLVAICCADTPTNAEHIARLSPDFIAIEPPELIGTGVSVSTAQPEIITRTLERVHDIDTNIPVLCGAGITNHEDVKKALELGTVGVLVSSAVVKSKDQRGQLEKLLRGS